MLEMQSLLPVLVESWTQESFSSRLQEGKGAMIFVMEIRILHWLSLMGEVSRVLGIGAQT